jgi:hypothetical protein
MGRIGGKATKTSDSAVAAPYKPKSSASITLRGKHAKSAFGTRTPRVGKRFKATITGKLTRYSMHAGDQFGGDSHDMGLDLDKIEPADLTGVKPEPDSLTSVLRQRKMRSAGMA